MDQRDRLTRQCPLGRSTVGAGDTFLAGMLFALLCHEEDWDAEAKLRFAVQLATRKVQAEGFGGVGTGLMNQLLFGGQGDSVGV